MTRLQMQQLVGLILGIGGIITLWVNAGFFVAAGAFFMVWGHNMEYHSDDD